MSDRISDLQDRLDRQYGLLKHKEFALDTEPQVTKGEVRLLIKQLKQEIVGVEREYSQRLAQQIKRSDDLPEPIALTIVGELVEELEIIESIAKTDEMRSMLQQILAVLRKPGVPAAAKLKLAIPLVPGFVAIELEGDMESVVRRLFSPLVRTYKNLKKK